MTQLAELIAQIKPDAWDVEVTYRPNALPDLILNLDTKARVLPDGRIAVRYQLGVDTRVVELLMYELLHGDKLKQARQMSLMEAGK